MNDALTASLGGWATIREGLAFGDTDDVARAVGVSETTVTHWERGKHSPRTKYMSALARCLAMPEDQLKAEAALSVDTLAPMTFDVPGFLDKLEALMDAGEDVRSILRALQGKKRSTARKKGKKKKKDA